MTDVMNFVSKVGIFLEFNVFDGKTFNRSFYVLEFLPLKDYYWRRI